MNPEHPASSPSCPDREAELAELALGTLSGRERAAVLAHLQTCPHCREEVEHLSVAADALVELAPEIEPPVGFEVRLFDRMGVAPGPPPVALTRSRSARRPAARLLAVAAAVVAILLAFGAGWLVSHGGSPTKPGSTTVAVARANLSHGGRTVGEVAIYAGSPGRITMRLDEAAAARGLVRCEVLLADGRAVQVGSFPSVYGGGSWSAPLPVPADHIAGARVVGPSGGVVATARLTT